MNISFQYNNTTYVFRRPTLGNTAELAFQRVQRRTRGGDLNIFRDPDWPKTETLNLNFVFTKESDLRRMLNFIELSIGQIITYIDHDNIEWSGVITNPETPGAQLTRSTFGIALIFEGERV